MDAYLNELFPPHSRMSKVLSSAPRAVLKADILRYSLLLREGGIYTDMDTAAVRPFEEWGTINTTDLKDPLLNAVPFYLGDSLTFEDPPPGAIFSLETPGFRGEWRGGNYARGLQIVQWTLASKPCHPVFIDTLGHVIKMYEDIIEQGFATPDVLGVLDWTGPGAFTDAVMRYMIARHGVYPRDLDSLPAPARIGDLLILPPYAFTSPSPERQTGDDHAAVWHGFHGSWRQHND